MLGSAFAFLAITFDIRVADWTGVAQLQAAFLFSLVFFHRAEITSLFACGQATIHHRSGRVGRAQISAALCCAIRLRLHRWPPLWR